MNALVQQDHEHAVFDAQMLPPQERGVTFEVLYFRRLQRVTNRIHETENIGYGSSLNFCCYKWTNRYANDSDTATAVCARSKWTAWKRS